MNDLISRKALLEVLRGLKPSGFEQSFAGKVAIRCIEAAPAVDAEPVRHGRWINKGYITTAYGSIDIADCTACGAIDVPIEPYEDYCPNCGAKMEDAE